MNADVVTTLDANRTLETQYLFEEGDSLADPLHPVNDPVPADAESVDTESESELEESLPLLPTQHTDSDNDSEMAEERTTEPIQFNRLANDDAEQWLKHFENYCAYKNYDEPKKWHCV